MNREKLIACMQYITPVERKIIDLVAREKKPGAIARKTGLHKEAVKRHIAIISDRIRELACNV